MARMLAILLLAAGAEDPGATLSGTVTLDAKLVPARDRRIRMDTAECANCHAEPPPSEEIAVDRETRGLKWAFVYVKKGLEGKTFRVPEQAHRVTQDGCIYKPRVSGVRVGQKVEFENGDPFLHNVHGLPFANKEFNWAQPTKGLVNSTTFVSAEVMVFVKCDVHNWMKSYIGVLDHPFFAVTDAKGRFEIKGLPPGTYELEVWAERFKSLKDIALTVKANETLALSFEFKEAKE
jgi:plastocyanin